MRWSFTVPTAPRGKGRPRFVRATGRTYTDQATETFEGVVAMAARACLGSTVLDGPLRVDVLAVAPRPKSTPKRAPAGLMWRAKKPDGDNVRKAVLDGMSACWRDDAQVVSGETLSAYSERDGVARVEVRVSLVTTEGPAWVAEPWHEHWEVVR